MPRPKQPPRLARIPNRDNWYVRDGREVISTGTENEEEAKCFLAEYLIAKETPKSPTIGQLLDMRLKDLQVMRKARAENTPYFHKPLKEAFGHLRPTQLSPAAIQKYRVDREHVPGALREELLELRTTLRMAERLDFISKVPYIEVPQKSPPRERFLKQEEAHRILAAAQAVHLKLYILIAMASGARSGAILGLTWDRVDISRRRLDFTDPERLETKKRRTVIPFGKNLAAALQDAQEMAQTTHVIEYMGKPISSLKKSFAAAARQAGLSWASPHILKHSVISWLAEDGVSLDRISDMTATDPKTVRRIYRKYCPDYLGDVAEKLDKIVGSSN